MRMLDLIEKKRDGKELTGEEILHVVSGYTRDQIPDYQAAAFLMAVFLRGMTRVELAALTEAMLRSGDVLDLARIPGPKADKHSTGGVGDKTSLVLAPIVAAGGVTVPMISGRGLAHTGGTLDKLESIPGFNVNLSLSRFMQVLEECGCGMIGQTDEIAPADKKFYALRGVTGTVASPYLICASIMSKKLAEGIDALVLDVKTGSGAFMKREEDAVFLADLMVETGRRMGKRTVALITGMDQPLGRAVGNALEVIECIEVLRGGGPGDLRTLSLELCAWMFCLAGRTPTVPDGRKLGEELIASGAGLRKFREIVRSQGGDPLAVDHPARLPRAAHCMDVTCASNGFVTSVDCEKIGVAVVLLGGGREEKDDEVDPAVGIRIHRKMGDPVLPGEPVCTIHYNSDRRLRDACTLIQDAYSIGNMATHQPRPLVRRIIQPAAGTEPDTPSRDCRGASR
ncbi:MAG: pyrimidine-nucleoside phosphorylase [Acidobacteria bacterium]|nr:pyrimidine-nucleoside phosphorylase [Acidobacteriota bacterium]